jgi:hypothetical protein
LKAWSWFIANFLNPQNVIADGSVGKFTNEFTKEKLIMKEV